MDSDHWLRYHARSANTVIRLSLDCDNRADVDSNRGGDGDERDEWYELVLVRRNESNSPAEYSLSQSNTSMQTMMVMLAVLYT